MPLPDSDALIEAGPTRGKPYLGSPGVVDQILRHALFDVLAARRAGDDLVEHVKTKAADLARVFLGQDSSYQASYWNREQGLATALVERCDIGGETSDAVMRLFVRMYREFIEDMASHEHERLSDEQFQQSIGALLVKYTHILIGRGDE